jgi:1-deoxy-D-xylulose-5-phosphate reductoisomerase
VTLLGATGSIGASTVDLLLRHRDGFAVEAVTGNRRVADLAAIARKLGAKRAVVADPAGHAALSEALADTGIAVASGPGAVVEAASIPVDWTMAGIVGAAGLPATFAAVRAARVVALANKESLVCAGALLMEAAAGANCALLPSDSEHNAIFQALHGQPGREVAEIVLTASGGPFRTAPMEVLRRATPEMALKHPTWSMGAKITIDSATLVNKGLELIEAHHLFAMPPGRLGVVVHPQSIVHGWVRHVDGSILAHLGPADMRVPIANCLAWPRRVESGAATLDLAQVGSLTFEAPDEIRFPGLALAREAMAAGGGAPCVLNAANEVAVEAFLAGRLGFMGIPAVIAETLAAASKEGLRAAPATLEEVLAVDATARLIAAPFVSHFADTGH